MTVVLSRVSLAHAVHSGGGEAPGMTVSKFNGPLSWNTVFPINGYGTVASLWHHSLMPQYCGITTV